MSFRLLKIVRAREVTRRIGRARVLTRRIGRAALVAAAICVVTAPSPSLAATAPDFVTNEALFWLDASTLPQLPGQDVTSWPDVRGEGHPVATTCRTVNPKMAITSGSVQKKKAVDFGVQGTDSDMKFADPVVAKMVFFVIDVERAQGVFLLGGPTLQMGLQTSYAFHRGSKGEYKYSNAPACTYWNNGVVVANPGNTVIPTGYQLITYRYDAADGTYKYNGQPINGAWIQYLGSDRDKCAPDRIGGKRICEVIAFSRILADDERTAVESYLRAKWFTDTWSWADDVPVDDLLGFAQVHFDASVASSFHYDTEDPTKVVQWDDLSGNGNHFTAHINESYNLTKYGTVGSVTGRPVFDSGTAPSGIDLKLATRITDTRSVVMVTDIDRTQAAFWLGDSGDYTFHRGAGGSYFYYQNWNWPAPEAGGSPWCNGVAIASRDNYPDLPGHLGIYVFNMAHDSCWCYLGQDRSQTARNGGKRVAELFTFNFELSDSARKHIEDYLFEKWTPSEAYIDSIAAVHVDASSASNFNYADANITGWKNSASGNDLVASSTYGSCGYTNGVTAFLMGQAGSGIDMTFDRVTNIRAVFWAMDIQYGVENAFFLGDTGTAINFHRGYIGYSPRGVAGAYFSEHTQAIAHNGTTYCDGARVSSPTTEKPPHGMHVFDLVSPANLIASSLSSDRNINYRNGGRAISELLILTNEVWGLTRAGVRRRMENKWTRKCGWAGAGDAEWGAGKYRVFDSDAVVPADGAAAVGVGFTANTTLSGGTLTLGDGGLFASEGVVATVSAPVAGKLGAYGLGTVNIATAPSTVDAISVGYGSTLVIAAGDTAISGGLSIQEKGKVVIDVSALAANRHVAVTFANCVLPAGGTLLDYVSLTGNTAGHVLTIGTDGLSIHVNDPSIALSAEWNGGMNDSATVAANWLCRNVNGEDLPNTTLPCFRTTNVVLNGDCDLRAWGTPVFADGVRIDLNGHVLRVASLADADFANAVITNSNAGALAELRVDVASGMTTTNLSVAINGNLKLVKEGLGTYVAAKTQQTYSGGTTILEGVLENAVLDARNYQLGAAGSTITVSTNGANRGVFDIKGLYAQNLGCAAYILVMNGGLVQNTGSDVAQDNGQFFDVRLTEDSEFSATSNWGLFSSREARATAIDLGGHALKVAIGANKILHVVNSELKNGFIDVTSGGWFQTGINGDANACLENVATNVDFRIGSALKIYAPLSMRDYEPAYGYDANDGTGVFSVHGTFKPAAHDYFYGVTLMDGSTIDLSQRTSALPLTSSFTEGKKTIDFAANAKVTVDLSGRADVSALAKNRDYVVTWTESTAPGADVTFRLDAATAAKYTLKADATGLRLGRGGFMLIVR